MKWPEFLKQIESASHITLIGPLYGRPHRPTTPTVYVDGGVQFLQTDLSEHLPTTAVGDGDSGEPSRLNQLLPQDKNHSDLAYVLSNLPNTIQKLDLFGFLGGRRDHELIGLGELHHYLTAAPHFRQVHLDDKVTAFSCGQLEIDLQGTFSLVVFETTSIKLTGACRFPLPAPTEVKAVSSHGLSNEGSGPVSIESSKPCFVFHE